MRLRFRARSALMLVLASVLLMAGQVPAMAVGTAQTTIPSQLPGQPGAGGSLAPLTPQVLDGTAPDGGSYRVLDMAQVGNRIVVVGTFAQVQNPGSSGTVYSRTNVFSFDPTTGLVDPAFAPTVPNGMVQAVAPGPDDNSVFIGGTFSQVDGVGPARLALVNLSDGSRTSGFKVPTLDAAVQDIAISRATNRVFLAGNFTTANGVPHGGLGSLNATTGALDPYMSLTVAGHHNYGVNPPPVGKTAVQAPVGVQSIDISPDGTRMIATGNFTSVSSAAGSFYRDQVASILLTPTGAAVDAGWATMRYHDACKMYAFDSYIRQVRWSPDGSYFVIVATGSYYAGTLCDAAARFNAADTGSAVQPAWVSYTGGDSLWTVAVTGAAVYVGGHQRWGNNPLAGDKAGAGAVPRPGITALDPLNGIPLTWNPGRNPRGHGAEALLATGQGLYVGMDTNWIGNFTYQRKKLAYFPLAGGTTPPSQDTGSLSQDNVYLGGTPGGGNNLLERSYDGTTAGPDAAGPGGGPAWSNVRGAFMAGNTLYYGFPDSSGTYEMARQSFDGKTFGPQQILNTPYKDPYWDGVSTGSGTTIYDGVFPNFYGNELKSVTGMFYAGGKLYYATPSGLFSRGFSIDSGIVGATSLAIPSTVFDFTKAGGMFLDGSNLYVVNKTTGTLSRMAFDGLAPAGTATVVSDPALGGRDWRANGLFLGPTGVNKPPVAAFTSSCPQLTCSFDASGSSDPEGGPLTYAWDFGDGASGTGVTPSHTYATAATFNVTLTVTDNQGATNAVMQQVTTTAPAAPPIAFKSMAFTSTPAGATSITITYPTVAPGDGLVLVLSNNSGSTTNSFGVTGTPPGFTQVGIKTALATNSTTNVAMTTQVFQRVATGSESGTKLTVPLASNGTAASAKATLQLLDYSGTAAGGPVRTVVAASDGSTGFSHTTPDAAATAGDWVVSVWSDKSSYGRTWTGPSGEVVRTNIGSTGLASEIATLVEDAGQAVGATGTVPGLTATVPNTTPSAKATMFSIVLAGS